MDRPFLTFTVRPEDDGRTLAGLLRTRYGMSRGLIRRLKKPGCALADGEEIPMTGRVRAGQVISLYLPAEAQSRVRPEPQPLAIVYEDRDLLVVEKPAGVLVHPSGVDRGGTLVNGVAHYLISRGEPSAAGPVTRLDRDTSGLVLFAKHPHAHHRLCVALAAGKVQRRYLALAEGDVQPDEGVIEAPIRRAPGALTRRAVLPGGQPARTYYRVLGRYNAAPVGLAGRFSLLELTLQTGRTHQIRVHLAHIGHPLLGDAMYGRALPGRLERQALHAHSLAFPHPRDGRPLTLASDLPDDLRALLADAPEQTPHRA